MIIPNSTHKKIGILISGGIDSTILYYILSINKFEHQSIHLFSMLPQKSKFDIFKHRISNITEFISKKTNVLSDVTYFSKIIILRKAVDLILQSGMDCVYTGCNKVPDIQFPIKNIIPGDSPPFRGPALNENHIRPFIDIEKPEIIKLYYKYNIQELMTLTHSCGFSLIQECGECFFCLEKKWGIMNVINN